MQSSAVNSNFFKDQKVSASRVVHTLAAFQAAELSVITFALSTKNRLGKGDGENNTHKISLNRPWNITDLMMLKCSLFSFPRTKR